MLKDEHSLAKSRPQALDQSVLKDHRSQTKQTSNRQAWEGHALHVLQPPANKHQAL